MRRMFRTSPNGKRLFATALGLVGISAAAVSLTPAAHASLPSSSFMPGQAVNKCMGVAGASTANFAKVIQWACVPTAANQFWHKDAVNSGWDQLTNKATNKCLEPENGSTADGAQMMVTVCYDPGVEQVIYAQLWHRTRVATYYPGTANEVDVDTWQNAASKKCLAVGGASTSDGAKIIQWDCNGRAEQKWYTSP